MNKGLLVLNVVLVIAVGYLLYVQLSSKKPASTNTHPSSATMPANSNDPFRIAYFEMDSIEKNYEMVKDVRAELNKQQESMNGELDKLSKDYQDKLNEYQSKASTMNQAQSDAATQDLMRRRDILNAKKQDLEQKYSGAVTQKMTEVKSKIEEFLKEFNKNRTYTYIISYEPGLFYYLDTAYNITPEVVTGLNEAYKKK
jgi:outer membrane protein